VDGMPTPPSDPLPISARARRRVQQWLELTHTSQAVLAVRIGKDQPWMSRYLSGAHDADIETLEQIAFAFGHTLFALLDTPADTTEGHLIEMYRAMKPSTRANVVRLCEDLIRPKSPRRVPKASSAR